MSQDCIKLYVAAIKGDWESISADHMHVRLLKSKITNKGETALHVAALAHKTEFVRKLLWRVKDRAFLETENNNECTALCYAATTGVVEIAKVMLESTYDIPTDRQNAPAASLLLNLGKIKPLSMAAAMGRHEMVVYLFDKAELVCWSRQDRIDLFTNFLRFGLFDEAEKMLTKYPEVATEVNGSNETALDVLARDPSLFVPKSSWRALITASLCRRRVGEDRAINMVKVLYNCTMAVHGVNLEEGRRELGSALLAAAEKGNDDFIIELVGCDPDLLWRSIPEVGTIFHVAVRNRRENIFSLLYSLGSIEAMIADQVVSGERNMLHLAAELAPLTQLKVVPGAALQMQRELLWFKTVEKIVNPSQREGLNSDNQTPQMVFDEKHKDLMIAGERWMKETSKSSMVVAALTATVMFTAAFTVPGGYNSSDGSPILVKRKGFIVFVLADFLSLISSSTSIIMFHSIITSRYAENDFLASLPFRMVAGVASLFVSVATMMVAFCATFLLYFHRENVTWIVALIAPLACVSSLYVTLKYPLLADLLRSAYHSRFMFNPRKQLFL